jgi:hypothetical protein
MHRLVLAIAAALVLLTGTVSKPSAAETAAATPEATAAAQPANAAAPAATGSIQKATVCGPKGCKHYWPRHYVGAVPPPPQFRPACPLDYYYACKEGPSGLGQCACWPYRTGWPYSW